MKLEIDIPINTPHSVERYERVLKEQKRVIELRKQGHTYAEIGEDLGLHPQTVSKRLRKAFEELAQAAYFDADTLRAVEHSRLEQAVMVSMEIMGDDTLAAEIRLKAVDRVERLSSSIRKLFGLDMPKRIEHDHRLSTEERLEQVKHTLGIEKMPTADREYRAEIVRLVKNKNLPYDEAKRLVDEAKQVEDADFEEIE